MNIMRKQYLIISFVSAVFLLGSSLSFAVEPKNLTFVKQELILYHDSGNYEYDVSSVINKARDYLEKRIAENEVNNAKKKLAVVLDVDDTAITLYSFLKKNDFGDTQNMFLAAFKKVDLPAIPETLSLYNFAKQKGLAVFFITGRKEYFRTTTVQELKNAGYKDWNGLYLRSNIDFLKPAAVYKTAIRKKITERGYDIVLSVGDQYSDLVGGYADYLVKLPNPFYFLP
jgi:predicted secreted acid phosphatase